MAKFYTYRNLNRQTAFSTKQYGVVVKYSYDSFVENGSFKVSEAGRTRCLRDKKRNVHAFIVSQELPKNGFTKITDNMDEIKYNPYQRDMFYNTRTGKAATGTFERIYLVNGRAYVDRIPDDGEADHG